MTPYIKASHLAIGYRRQAILDSIDFELPEGSMSVLIGANGSGKSTLLRTLAGILMPVAGNVTIGGYDAASLTRREMAARLAVVFPERRGGGALTVSECVAIGRHIYAGPFGRLGERDRAAIAASLDAVGMSAKADRYLGTLSDGERQKVMIARALAQEAPALILDEPTAFLDVAGKADITRLLRLLADSGRTILISTHDIAPALAAADTLMVVDPAGRTVHTGPKADIISAGVLDLPFAAAGLRFDPDRGDFVG